MNELMEWAAFLLAGDQDTVILVAVGIFLAVAALIVVAQILLKRFRVARGPSDDRWQTAAEARKSGLLR